MPIQARVTPTQEQDIAKESGAFRVHGPSKELPDTPLSLTNAFRREFIPLVSNIQPGTEISLVAQHALRIVEKIQNGEDLTPQDVAAGWLFAQEAIGRGGRGGIRDKESIYRVKGNREQRITTKRLRDLQVNIARHLTQEKKIWIERIGWSHFDMGVDLYGARAEKLFKLTSQHETAYDAVAQKLHQRNWAGLNEQQQREVQTRVLEDMYINIGSSQVQELLTTIGQHEAPLEELLKQANQSTNSAERRLAQLAGIEQKKNLQTKILRSREQVRGLQNIEDFQRFIGLNPEDPNQMHVLTEQDIADSVIRYYSLTGAEADTIRRRPNEAVMRVASNPAELTLFVNTLYYDKFQKFSLDRSPSSVPEKLKKPASEQKVGEKFTKDAKPVEAIHMVLMKLGKEPDPNKIKTTLESLGFSKDQADDLLRKAGDEGFIGQKKDQTGDVIKDTAGNPITEINTDQYIRHATPEMLAQALHRRQIENYQDIMDVYDEMLKDEYKDDIQRQDEIIRRVVEIQQRSRTLEDTATKTQKVQSAATWNKRDFAGVFVLGLFGSAQFLQLLGEPERQQAEEYLA